MKDRLVTLPDLTCSHGVTQEHISGGLPSNIFPGARAMRDLPRLPVLLVHNYYFSWGWQYNIAWDGRLVAAKLLQDRKWMYIFTYMEEENK